MPSQSIMSRLDSGQRLLMDGALGSEIQRRGADVLRDATSDTGLQAWSATANVEYADVVQQVHQDYLRVGADIILTNNFWANRPRLDRIRLGDRWREYASAAGENAVQARDELGTPVIRRHTWPVRPQRPLWAEARMLMWWALRPSILSSRSKPGCWPTSA